MSESNQLALTSGIVFVLTVIVVGLLIPENTHIILRILIGGAIGLIVFTLIDKLIKKLSKKS